MARGLTKGGQSQKQIPCEVKSARETNVRMISQSQAELLFAAAVFVVAALLYTLTLAPTVTLVDSGELILAAWGSGVAHPPGFPLWVMFAHLASLVPFGNVAMRMNFSSALFAALACATLTLVMAELITAASYLPASNRTRKAAQQIKKREDPTGESCSVFAAVAGAGLLMTFSRTLWSYAT